jgi:NADH-quinone oxidoreductase subunit M
LWMGIYPSSFTSYFDATVGSMVQHHAAALGATTKMAGIPPAPAGMIHQ